MRLGALIALLTCALAGGRVSTAQSLVVAATHHSRVVDYGLRRFAQLGPASTSETLPASSTGKITANVVIALRSDTQVRWFVPEA